MQPSKRCKNFSLSAFFCLLLSSCTGAAGTLGVHDSKLSPCPARPNCVSSDSAAAEHRVEPFHLAVPAAEGWQMARTLVAELPRTTIITQGPDYLHAECRSAVFGFVDDLELHLRPDKNTIAVRSAARLGYSDLGVNRKRIEDLRSKLTGRGAIDLSP
ncbi:MAG TPA: DUF1499 domain-containing protein [Malonomonas sp.]